MMSKDTAKQEIKSLVDKYNKVVEEGRFGRYNEEMTKKDFILPLFRALGWNTEDSSEVTAEEKISKKRVDYGFRINGIPKFFLEAKSLKADLDNAQFIDQAINYAWHKGCTWAILTDFESVKIFNAEWKTANVMQSHLKTIPCQEYLDRFGELWFLSKDGFEQGSLDKEAEKWGKKTKKSPVDKQLLSDFTGFREMLSKNINMLNENRKLTGEELDESVQRILDRLIFIRNCEDRGLEGKTLISIYREWESSGRGHMIKNLRLNFAYFDKEYNSKIFSKHLCDELEVDNDVLHEIIEGLYYTKDKSVSYDFSAIEADVLGNIYEQYLSHILRKRAKGTKLTESHAHRKEQGIYYTPTYIVDYIVKNTLGEMLKDKKVSVDKIRILDPACGSGSFLIKAFDLINEYHKKHDRQYSQTRLDLETGIPYTTKVKILQNNIHGVDLDKQAIEIAQLNLLLKIAEKGHRLPLLQESLKCGNSLIDNPAVAGKKAFDWHKEFKKIMDEGGFDVIIGNPPYIFARSQKFSEKEKYFYYKNYGLMQYQLNTYILFIEKAIKLLKKGGYFGFIVPNTWQSIDTFTKFRKYLFENMSDIVIVNITDKIFSEANVDTSILIFKKDEKSNRKVQLLSINEGRLTEMFDGRSDVFGQQYIISFSGANFKKVNQIVGKIEKASLELGSISTVKAGLKAYEVGKGTPEQTVEMKNQRIYHADKQVDKTYYKYLEGKDVCRYVMKWSGKYLKYGNCLAAPRTFDLFSSERILVRQIPSKLPYSINAVYENQIFLNDINSMIIYDFKQYSPKVILGLLNSKLMTFWFSVKFNKLQRSLFPQFKVKELKQFPIVKNIDKNIRKEIVMLVDGMLSLNKRLGEMGNKMTEERVRIEEEIKKTDLEIDDLVYKLYEITDEERKIIEESLK